MSNLYNCRYIQNVPQDRLPGDEEPQRVSQTVRAADPGFAYSAFVGWLRSAHYTESGEVTVRQLLDEGHDGVLTPNGYTHTFKV